MPELYSTFTEETARQDGAGVSPQRLIEFSERWFTHYEREFEQYVYPRIKDNVQLLHNYDDALEARRRRSKRVVRQSIVIPKVQPEVFTAIANELSAIIGATPVFRVMPPKNAEREMILRCADIEAGINDFLDTDDWFFKFYAVLLWGSVAPYAALEVFHEEDIAFVPTEEISSERQFNTDAKGFIKIDQFGQQQFSEVPRLKFVEEPVRIGPKSKILYPWEFFFEHTAPPEDVPVSFVRHLLSADEITEKIDSGEWQEPDSASWKKDRPKSRNWGLEILRSVPAKGNYLGTSHDEERHEVLKCTAVYYNRERRQKSCQQWWMLDRKHVLRMPEDLGYKRLKSSYLIYAQKPLPPTQLGIPRAESIKQIARATNRLFNRDQELGEYSLYPITYMGQSVDFAEEVPGAAPGLHIPLTGPVEQIKQVQVPYAPEKTLAMLSYLDGKGQLSSDVNDTMQGRAKPGGAPTLGQIEQELKGAATKLGLFILLDAQQFLAKWAEMFYWVAMEKNPVRFFLAGQPYDLRNWVIPGGPKFDLPQVGEVAGRASEKALLAAAYAQYSQNPVFLDPAISEETHPRLFALLRKHAYASGYTWIDEVLYPTPNEIQMPKPNPAIIEMLLAQRSEKEKGEQDALARSNGGLGRGDGGNAEKPAPAGS